jgi:hypothetical protein
MVECMKTRQKMDMKWIQICQSRRKTIKPIKICQNG